MSLVIMLVALCVPKAAAAGVLLGLAMAGCTCGGAPRQLPRHRDEV